MVSINLSRCTLRRCSSSTNFSVPSKFSTGLAGFTSPATFFGSSTFGFSASAFGCSATIFELFSACAVSLGCWLTCTGAGISAFFGSSFLASPFKAVLTGKLLAFAVTLLLPVIFALLLLIPVLFTSAVFLLSAF